jgi:hypothetical protein
LDGGPNMRIKNLSNRCHVCFDKAKNCCDTCSAFTCNKCSVEVAVEIKNYLIIRKNNVACVACEGCDCCGKKTGNYFLSEDNDICCENCIAPYENIQNGKFSLLDD